MTDRELMQMALEALEEFCEHGAILRPLERREALRVALAQPENEFNPDWGAMSAMVEEQQRMSKRIEELEAALAQPEPEPFEYWNAVEGWVKIEEVRQHFDTAGCGTIYKTSGEGRVPLYTAPQREWQGLTKEEYEAMAEKCVTNCYFDTLKYARAIEARLRDKNS